MPFVGAAVALPVDLARVRDHQAEHRVDRDLAPVRQGERRGRGIGRHAADRVVGVARRTLADLPGPSQRQVGDVPARELGVGLERPIGFNPDRHR